MVMVINTWRWLATKGTVECHMDCLTTLEELLISHKPQRTKGGRSSSLDEEGQVTTDELHFNITLNFVA